MGGTRRAGRAVRGVGPRTQTRKQGAASPAPRLGSVHSHCEPHSPQVSTPPRPGARPPRWGSCAGTEQRGSPGTGRPPSTLLMPRALRGHGARCPALMHLPPESIASLRRTRPHGPFRTRGSDTKAAAARPRPSPDCPVAAPGRVRTRRRRARCLRAAATGQIHGTGARGTRQLSARSSCLHGGHRGRRGRGRGRPRQHQAPPECPLHASLFPSQ